MSISNKNVIAFPQAPPSRLPLPEINTRGVVHDLTERKRSDDYLRRLAMIVESSNDAIIGKTLEGIILSWNQAAERLFGYSALEAIGNPICMLVPPDYTDEMPQFLERIARGESIDHYETERLCKNGKRISVALTISPIKDPLGAIVGASTIARDITERKRAEDRIHFLALHDALTGLPNRILFRERVTQAITQARRNLTKVAVLFIDLDHFKEIKDSLGHQIGDRLLQLTANRLRHCLREGDSVARLGGDQFVINLPDLNDSNDAKLIAEKVVEVLREPFRVDQHALQVNGSVGIGIYPSDGQDVESLMCAADTAMYHAKKKGRGSYHLHAATALKTCPPIHHC